MNRPQYLAIALFAAVAVPLTHCAETDPFSSESHFLDACASGCGQKLGCICGVCSLPCTANSACAPLSGAACLAGTGSCSTAKLCDVACSRDADCAAPGRFPRCVEGRCRASSPTDASVSDSEAPLGDATFRGRGPQLHLDAGHPVTLGDSGVNSQGDCQFPVAPPLPEATNACGDVPDAPGADACPPSVASDYGTPCCTAGVCAFDFGKGCTYFPYTPPGGETAITAPACSAGSGVPGVIFGDRVDDFAIGDDGPFVLTSDQNGNSPHVVAIRNSDCTERTIYDGTDAAGIEVVGQTVYVATRGGAHGQGLLAVPAAGGTPTTIDLRKLLGSSDVYFAMGRNGTSLVLETQAKVGSDASLEYQAGFVEIPCCGGAPRVLAVSSDINFPMGERVLSAGTFLFAPSQLTLLNSGLETKVGSLELASNRTSTLLSGGLQIAPYDAHDGLLYVVPGGAIVTIDPLTCIRRQLVARPSAYITALSVAPDGTVFWAESYTPLTVSRMFMMRKDSTSFSQIQQIPGTADTLHSDGAYLYWLTYSPKQLIRAARPQ